MKKSSVSKVVRILVLSVVFLSLFISQSFAADEITLAVSSPHIWIQPIIAQCEGYYEQAGLNVKMIEFSSGRAAVDALIGGQADMATTAISPAIFAAFQKQPIAILAVNATYFNERITVRTDSGIEKPEDLKGKKIGVQLGTDVHYFLMTFLEHYGLSEKDVELINLNQSDMVIGLVRGDIDAFAAFKPAPDNAKEAMQDGAFFFEQPQPPFFESLYLTVGMQKLVAERPEVYEKFMNVMVKADEFAAENPDAVVKCISSFTGDDAETVKSLMDGYTYSISLSDSLIEASEKRAQWQIDNDLSPEGAEMPDFRSVVCDEPLLKAAPDRVSLSK